MILNTHGEIIVYLDYHSKVIDGGGDLILDFRSLDDFTRFVGVFKELSEDDSFKGTYLRITGYITNKRLIRGCYYSLNVELLRKATLEKKQDSYLFIAEFDFKGVISQGIRETGLLLSHKPLDPKQLIWPTYSNHEGIDIQLCGNNLQLYVADVGQANWNELRSNGFTVVQYDMGAEIYAKSQSVDNIYNMHRQQIDTNNKAILVISHWDMDHVHCLYAMSDDDIRNTFRMVICPNALKSNTAWQILQHLTNILGYANVYCVSPYYHTPYTDYHMHLLCPLNNNIVLYIGENRRNLNYSGIVMMVKGNSSNVNYTGDCLLRQAEEARFDATSRGLQSNSHILVAPHHGGMNEKKYMQYNTMPQIQQMVTCISVGKGNPYGHPNAKMLNYLNAISRGNIIRTDNQGDITINI